MGYYTWDNYQASCVKIDSMAGTNIWRNDDNKLAAAECVEMDTFIGALITQPHENTVRQGKFGSYIHGRYGTSMIDGLIRAEHRFQTAQFIYWMMQACATTDDTPGVGYHTHAITTRTTQVPINLGYHVQAKHSSDNLLWDLLGMTPSTLNIRCSEKVTDAMQTIEIPYAYLQSAGDDFTKTARPEGTTGTIVKKWDHFVTGGLGGGQTVFTYNAGSTECDIIGISITLRNNTWMGTRDSDGFSTVGLVKDLDWQVELEVVPTGDQLFTLSRTKAEDYAGDLDLTFSVIADATNDKITFTFDKLFMLNFNKSISYENHPEVYRIVLEPLSDASSLAVTAIDSLVDDYYET